MAKYVEKDSDVQIYTCQGTHESKATSYSPAGQCGAGDWVSVLRHVVGRSAPAGVACWI